MMYEFEKPFIADAVDFEARFGWAATPAADVCAPRRRLRHSRT